MNELHISLHVEPDSDAALHVDEGADLALNLGEKFEDGGTHAVACKLLDTGTHTFTDMESLVTQTEVGSRGRYVPTGAYISSATAGDVLCANADESGVGTLFMYGTADSESVVISIGDFKGSDACFVMPDSDVVVVYTS